MKPKHPYDLSFSSILPSLTFGTKRTLEVSAEPGRGAILPYPTRIEAYTYDLDRNIHLYQALDTTDIKVFNLTLPSEAGLNMFLFKVFYGDEVQGISYHPIMIFTK